MNRRELIQMSTVAAAGLLLHEGAFAQSAKAKPLKVLIFGGTGFIGPHFVRELRDGGHKLTLFNRGKRNPGLFPDVETLLGDRNEASSVDLLRGREWDVVVDDSGYFPRQVRASVDALKDHVQHYIYVSSISAYADLTPAGIDEDYKLAPLEDPDAKEITEKNYGGLKAACEQIVEQTFGTRQAVIRPSYIVGPGDHTDRFTYWPWRFARGGEMFAPGTPEDPMQFIDVRDLAEFTRRCVEQRIAGRYNLCNPPGAVTMGDVLEASKHVTQANTKIRWAPLKFLEDNKLLDSGELTTWSPPTGEFAGASLVSSARAVAKGLRFRSVDTTVRDLLAWHDQRPAEQKQKLRAGLTPEREAELLKKLPA
jgi:nucleoside-diphosphate-sugar epimerase